MTPFEKHGITHLSPSSLNLYAASPALWTGRYMLGWKEAFGPSAARGTAIENGLDSWLYQRNKGEALEGALANFALNTQGQADEDHEAERANIEPMLSQAIEALKDCPKPIARQMKIEHRIDGIEVPVIGYLDYLFEDWGLDLKTTKACPSSPKADHCRQVATYAKAKGRPFSLLYVTAKKSALYPLTDNEAAIHLRDLERSAHAVRHLLSKSENGRDAMKIFAADTSDFRWSDKTRDFMDKFYSPINQEKI